MLPDKSIRWGQSLNLVRAHETDGFELVVRDVTVERFDLVIGTDGAWSRVRPLLSPARPEYTGLTFFELEIRDVDACHPAIARLVSHGLLIAGAERKIIFAQRNTTGHVRVYVALHVNQNATAREDGRLTAAEQTRSDLVQQFVSWDDALTDLIAVADDWVRPWPIYSLQVGHRWLIAMA